MSCIFRYFILPLLHLVLFIKRPGMARHCSVTEYNNVQKVLFYLKLIVWWNVTTPRKVRVPALKVSLMLFVSFLTFSFILSSTKFIQKNICWGFVISVVFCRNDKIITWPKILFLLTLLVLLTFKRLLSTNLTWCFFYSKFS